MLNRVEDVLKDPRPVGWMARWLEVLKVAHSASRSLDAPPFGFGDETSTMILREASKAVHVTGAVRHAAECFNFTFPQELDDEFLVSDPAIA